jgi:hypothetical protein
MIRDTIPQWIKIEKIRQNMLTYGCITCEYCHREIDSRDVHFDHMLPRAHHGKSILANIAVACRRCNQWKKDKDYESFLKLLINTQRGKDACKNKAVIIGLSGHIQDISDYRQTLKNKINKYFLPSIFCNDCIYNTKSKQYCRIGREISKVKSCKYHKSVSVVSE